VLLASKAIQYVQVLSASRESAWEKELHRDEQENCSKGWTVEIVVSEAVEKI